MTMSAKNRERREKCKGWIRRSRSLDEARRLAKIEDHFEVNTSVWIGALGEVLAERTKREE